MPIVRRRCVTCTERFELLSYNGHLSALDHPDLDRLTCPKCGGRGEAIIAPTGRDTMEYPYYDRGLGTVVKDRKHHRWLLVHEPNGTVRDVPLIQTHGEFDVDEQFEAFETADRQVADEYAAQQRELTEGPNRHDYRRLHDFIAEHGTALWEDS
jgi:hypothetical protein